MLKTKLIALLVASLTALPAFGFTTGQLEPQKTVRFPTVGMNPGMAEKDERNGVIYLNESQREARRIVIIGGLVFTSKGEPVPDSIEPKNKNGDLINYVMDNAGNFYLFDEYKTPRIRHSSILGLRPVAGAGEIEIRNQHILKVDANSGHYYTRPLLSNVINELRRSGVTFSER